MSVRGVVRAGHIEILEGPPLPEGATVELDVKTVRLLPDDPALELYGVWADRADLGDSREAASRLRDDQWRR